MKSIKSLHNEAMQYSELAILAKLRENLDLAEFLFEQSLECELEAIKLIENIKHSQPTYSILCRSAATLALDCNNVDLVKELVIKALASEPPIEIKEELSDLLKQIKLKK